MVNQTQGESLTLAAIPKSTGGEFWETVANGAKKAAADLGVELKWEGTVTETEIAEQNKIIENMINGSANFHYDEMLSKSPDSITYLRPVSWRRISPNLLP